MTDQRKQIEGTWPDGHTATATQYHASLDGEWLDDHFGQAFDFDLAFIGPDVDEARVTAHARHSFWEGVSRVVFMEAK